MSEEPTVEPEESSNDEPPVLILPGQLFFVDSFEIPEALEDAELNDFTELSLEGIAPFPVEQLYWGFFQNQESNEILVYAALKDRLRALGYKALESYTWVLPDFATLFGAHFPSEQAIVIQTESSQTIITLPAGESLPSAIKPAGTSETPTRATLSVELLPIELNEKAIPTFRFTSESEDIAGHWQEIHLSEAQLWRADVRDLDFKKAERNSRRMTGQITRITAYAVIIALILILLELVLIGGDFWMKTRMAKIDAQSPDVRRVEDKQSLMNKLDQVAQSELRPIAILEALNQARPEGIYFTSTVTEGRNRITIDGVANTINELNAYTDALKNSGAFILIGDPKYLTRSGETTFSVTLDYDHSFVTSEEGEKG